MNEQARVLLLNPPTAAQSTEISLSLAYLASSLRMRNHVVKIIDATAPFNPKSAEEVKKEIIEFNPHFIGVTITITFVAQTYDLLEDLKKLGIPIVAGGSHVNPLPEEALARGVDIVALGEGERTIVELADYFIGKNKNLQSIPGLCIKNNDGTYHKTEPRSLIENIDEIPFPSFDDFPIKNYTGRDDVDSNPIFWALFSSRGCPFNCTFCCGYNVFGRTYRFRSAQNIFAEIKLLIDKYGVKKIAFQDDEILINKKRILELYNLLLENKLKIRMSLRSRIDSIDVDLLRKMQEVGFRRISFGIESWNDETLKKINKRFTLKDIKKGLNVLDASEFPYINFNTIIGFPWETKEHLKKNLKTLAEIPKSLRYFSVVVTPIPYPNTLIYNDYHKEYGFTNWWLNPKMHWDGFPASLPRPIFLCFAKMMMPLYTPDLFWHYSKKRQKEFEWFCWNVFKLSIRRHVSFRLYLFIYSLSRLSHFAWKISPQLEHAIFRFVPKRLIAKAEKMISFTNME